MNHSSKSAGPSADQLEESVKLQREILSRTLTIERLSARIDKLKEEVKDLRDSCGHYVTMRHRGELICAGCGVSMDDIAASRLEHNKPRPTLGQFRRTTA